MANSEPDFGSLTEGHLSRVSSDPSSQVFGGDRQTFVVAQDGDYHRVKPFSHEDFDGMTVEEFYGYDAGDSAANLPIDIEEENTSQLFFYEGPEEVSLVALHDTPGSDTETAETQEEIVLDDFEDGSFERWELERGHATVIDRNPLEGEYSMSINPSRNWNTSTTVWYDGEETPPKAGDQFSYTFELRYDPDDQYNISVYFGCQDYLNRVGDRYRVGTGTKNDEIVLNKRVDGGGRVLDSQHVEWSIGQQYELVVDWGTDGTIVVELYEGRKERASEPIITLSGTDTEFTEGDFAFNASTRWISRHQSLIDDIRIRRGGESGGAATFEFDWLPLDGSWEVKDDPDAFDDSDGLMSDLEPTWEWADGETAGGAHSGFHRALGLVLTPEFGEGIDEWVLVDGGSSSPERIELEKKPIAIGTLGAAVNDVEYKLDIGHLYGSACIYTEDLGQFCVTLGPDGIDGDPGVNIGPRDCTDAPGGKTPPLVSIDIEYTEVDCSFLGDCDEVTHSRKLWVGAELRGRNPCLWIGEDETGACLKLDDRCGNLQNAVRDGEPVPSEVDTLADAVYEAAREEFSELELPPKLSAEGVLLGVGVIFAFLLLVLAVLVGAKIAVAIGGITLTFGAAAGAAS